MANANAKEWRHQAAKNDERPHNAENHRSARYGRCAKEHNPECDPDNGRHVDHRWLLNKAESAQKGFGSCNAEYPLSCYDQADEQSGKGEKGPILRV
jgi:hypothetical protein